jgi:hypothetical protein
MEIIGPGVTGMEIIGPGVTGMEIIGPGVTGTEITVGGATKRFASKEYISAKYGLITEDTY